MTGTYTIGEVAARSGFSTSALRYYESIGLVPPAGRSDAGYRLYDDHTLARLAFVARAKRLGCSLDEITDLIGLWDGERCGPVQRRFHDLVTAKVADVRRRTAELSAFAGQLAAAAGALAGPAPDGPCGAGCACLAGETVPSGAVRAPERARRLPVVAAPTAASTAAGACTLAPDEVPARRAGWRGALAHVTRRSATADGGLRLSLGPDADLAGLARLVAAEQACCDVLAFALTVDGRGVALEVRAPAGAEPLVADLFGTAA
ncbi:MAG TPA: MerR family transcriptional regulator [Acidimicrobiales bacterium]|nr:MerR family transcriptional regulator [Acidimicrobiales bacterium]